MQSWCVPSADNPKGISRLDYKAHDASKWSATAKRLVTYTGFNIANDALQLLGGHGYLQDYGTEKLVRDLRIHQTLEGTNEIMRVIIARHLIARQYGLGGLRQVGQWGNKIL